MRTPVSIEATDSGTSALLRAGTVAGPLFAVVALLQATLREGFEPTRHAVSQLALGPGGWVQVVNFLVTGALTVACALGLRRTLRGGRGSRWSPGLVAVMGLGFIAAAFFRADPGNGFPPGTADGPEPAVSAAGLVHLACAGIAFIALIAACFVLASRYSATGDRPWAAAGRACGILLAVGFAVANTGTEGGPLAMFAGAVIAWVWVGVTASRLAAGRAKCG